MAWFGNDMVIREGREYHVVEKNVPATPDQLHRLEFRKSIMKREGFSVLIEDDDLNGSTKKLLRSVHPIQMPQHPQQAQPKEEIHE